MLLSYCFKILVNCLVQPNMFNETSLIIYRINLDYLNTVDSANNAGFHRVGVTVAKPGDTATI